MAREMVMCEFCHSGDDVEAQDMGEGRVMQLCVNCRVNVAENDERAAEFNRERAEEARPGAYAYAAQRKLKAAQEAMRILMQEDWKRAEEWQWIEEGLRLFAVRVMQRVKETGYK